MRPVSAAKLVTMSIPKPEYLVGRWLVSNTVNMVFGSPGVGKTFFSLSLAGSVASGRPFLKWRTASPRPVLYIDGEMGAHEIQSRIKDLHISDKSLLFAISDLEDEGVPDLSTQGGRNQYSSLVDETRAGLVVFDNLSCLCRSAGDENSAESWAEIQAWANELKRRTTVLFVHHSGKAKQGKDGARYVPTQRGTSRREDNMRSIVQLLKPPFAGDEGCSYEVFFRKSSFAFGNEIAPIRVDRQGDDWTWTPIHNVVE